jgi:hypothetical protein
MSINFWDVPSVCTGYCINIGSKSTEADIIKWLVRNFGYFVDYAMFWHPVHEDIPNAKAQNKVFDELLHIPYFEKNGIRVYYCSNIYVDVAIDKFFGSPISLDYGYKNYEFLTKKDSNIKDYKKHELAKCSFNQLPYDTIGYDAVNGTNSMMVGIQSKYYRDRDNDDYDDYDDYNDYDDDYEDL